MAHDGGVLTRTSLVKRISTVAAVLLVSMGAGGGPGAGPAATRTGTAPELGSVAGHGSDGDPTPAAVAAFNPTNVALSLTLVRAGFSQPVLVTNAGDGSGRLFVVEQTGLIRIISGRSTLATPFIDLRAAISTGGERGLLGLAFHPNYPTVPYFYVNFTDRNGSTAIDRFRVSSNANVADRSSGVRLMTIAQPYSNHNGGNLAFGRDGYLYIGMGDGGSAGDPGNRAQSLNSLLGKLLRIDVNHTSGSKRYAVPATNPYVGTTGLDEIFARGLRNPWRWSFDRANGNLWIGDVGQDRYEEVDRSIRTSHAAAGRAANYGWNVLEGRACYKPSSGCSTSGKTMPLTTYAHAVTGDDNCSITGGFVYRGSADPVLQGGYIYGDFCSGRIFLISATATAPATGVVAWSSTATPHLAISSFGEDEAGELYVCDRASGAIYRIRAAPKA
ncbi:MAG: PQQ-dependent sugar dehydrogenase [Chloroflexota bacterium]